MIDRVMQTCKPFKLSFVFTFITRVLNRVTVASPAAHRRLHPIKQLQGLSLEGLDYHLGCSKHTRKLTYNGQRLHCSSDTTRFQLRATMSDQSPDRIAIADEYATSTADYDTRVGRGIKDNHLASYPGVHRANLFAGAISL